MKQPDFSETVPSAPSQAIRGDWFHTRDDITQTPVTVAKTACKRRILHLFRLNLAAFLKDND